MSFNQILHCVQYDSLALMSFPLPHYGGSARKGEGGLFPLPHHGGSARRAKEAFFYWRECPQGEEGFLQLSVLPLKNTAMAMSKVSTPPKRYANMRFSIPNIIGDMNIYDEQTYVIINAGNAPIAIGLLFLYK